MILSGGPKGAGLEIELRASEPNELWVVAIENFQSQPRPTRVFAAEARVNGGGQERVTVRTDEFREIFSDASLESWDAVNLLGLAGKYRFVGNHMKLPDREIGADWKGPAPEVRRIQWTEP